MKQILTGLLCVIFCNIIHGQLERKAPSIQAEEKIHSSPNFAGGHSIGVPVTSIEDGGLSLALGLAYNTDGIKGNDISSPVGLGWTMEGLPIITRSVRGRVDEGNIRNVSTSGSSGYENDPGFSSVNGLSIGIDDGWGSHVYQEDGIDSQSDVYLFKFGSSVVSFSIGFDGNPVLHSPSDIRIERTVSQTVISNNLTLYYVDWIVTLADGTVIKLEEEEEHKLQLNGPDPKFSSIYYPTEITSFSGKDKILFSYSFENYSYTDIKYKDYKVETNGTFSSDPAIGPNERAVVLVSTPIITQISNGRGTEQINFTRGSRIDLGASRINEIEKITRGVIQSTEFEYSYFSSPLHWYTGGDVIAPTQEERHRLKLNGLKKKINGNELPGYDFEYVTNVLPWRNTYGVDHWGYINGQNSNATLVPQGIIYPANNSAINNSPISGKPLANRTINSNYASYGKLKKMRLPTGGAFEYLYESNTAFNSNGVESIIGGLRLDKILERSSEYSVDNTHQFEYYGGKSYSGVSGDLNYLVDANYGTYAEYRRVLPNFINTRTRNLLDSHVGYDEIRSVKADGSYTATEYFNNTSNFAFSFPITSPPLEPMSGLVKESKVIGAGALGVVSRTKFIYDVNVSDLFKNVEYALYSNGNIDVKAWTTYYDKFISVLLSSKEVYSDGVLFNEDYTYDSGGVNLIESTMIDSEQIEHRTNYYYARELNNSVLIAENRVNQILKTKEYADNIFQGGHEVSYAYKSGIYLPVNSIELLGNGAIEVEHVNDIYNNMGMLLESHSPGDISKSTILDVNSESIVAEVANAKLGETAYTSFESSNSMGGWSFMTANIETNSAKLGEKVYRLNTPIEKSVSSGNYILAFWVRGQGTLKAGSQSIQGSSEWKYYEIPVSGNYSSPARIYQTVAYTPPSGMPTLIFDNGGEPGGGGGSYSASSHDSYLFLDEVRLFPADAQMSTFTYRNDGLLDGQADINGIITTYEYDEFYRLKNVKDKNGAIVKAHKYGNPTTGKHWVSEFIPQETYISSYTFDNLSAFQVHRTTSYADGLGRPMATEANGMSPSGKDIISFSAYDSYGKMPKEYMAYTGTFNVNTSTYSHIAASINFYKGLYGNSEGQYAYTQKVFESDISGRAIAATIPGIHHHINSGRTVQSSYRSNQTSLDGAVYDFSLNGGSIYSDAQLLVVESTDPDGRVTKVFSDNMGRKIMEDNAGLQTYFIYDLRSNLLGVLPPETTKKAKTNSQRSYAALKTAFGDEMYWYEYDTQNRLSKKHIPGADPISYGYDALDRPVWTLDGNGNKTYQEYDILSRPTKSGIYNGSSKILHKEIFYDNYNNATGQPFVSRTGYDASSYGFVRGEVTGSRTKILDGGNTFMKSTAYYDEFHRPIYTTTENHAGGYDQLWSKYDFNGRELESTYFQNAYAGLNIYNTTIKDRSEYDHAGRLKKTFKSVNGAPEINVSTLIYNEAGDLVSKKLHTEGTTSWVTENYKYNIRGRLYRQDAKKADGSELYFQQYYYNNSNKLGSYSGNMFRTLWRADGVPTKRYDFKYDAHYRLTRADYRIDGATNTMAYDVRNLAYDDNGNITKLQRYDQSGTIMDNLTMQYTTDKNHLSGVTETANQNKGFVSHGSGNYIYDNNGNLTRDPFKKVSIVYNHFGTPTTVSNDDTAKGSVSWVFDGDGNTLSMQSSLPGSAKRLYVNGFEYYGSTLESVMFDEGQIKFCDGGQNVEYEYHVADHLGNTRMAYSKVNGQIRINQESHYYPFGMEMEGSWNNVYCADNRYKYNGIEKIEEAGLDNYFAYYRSLDPSIGRWWQVDPRSEEVMHHNAYVSMGNNPINYTDPLGDMFSYSSWGGGGLLGGFSAPKFNNIVNPIGANMGGIANSLMNAFFGSNSTIYGNTQHYYEHIYFDTNGNYLGEDNLGDEIRIIKNPDKSKPYNGQKWILYSQSSLSSRAHGKIGEHFQKKILNRKNIVPMAGVNINAEMATGNLTLMSQGKSQQLDKNGYSYGKYGELGIAVFMGMNGGGSRIFDDMNIYANVLEHELYHYDNDYINVEHKGERYFRSVLSWKSSSDSDLRKYRHIELYHRQKGWQSFKNIDATSYLGEYYTKSHDVKMGNILLRISNPILHATAKFHYIK